MTFLQISKALEGPNAKCFCNRAKFERMQQEETRKYDLSGDRPVFYGAALQVPLDLPWSQYMCNGWGNERLDLCFPMHFES